MGKRPRTPHFITGIGDGNVHDHKNNDVGTFGLRGNVNNKPKDPLDRNPNSSGSSNNNNVANNNADYYFNLRAAYNERLQRLEEPLLAASGDGQGGPDLWKDVFGNPVLDHQTIGKSTFTAASGPWQVSAFAFLGFIVVVSAVVLHFVSDAQHQHHQQQEDAAHNHSSPYMYRRRQRQRRKQQMRKKKTDEWSDDEEPIQDGIGLIPSDKLLPGMILPSAASSAHHSPDPFEDGYQQQSYYYQGQTSNSRFQAQDSRLRRTANKEHCSPAGSRDRRNSGGSNFYLSQQTAAAASAMGNKSPNISGVNPTYKSPAPNKLLSRSSAAPRMPKRGLSPTGSFNSHSSHGYSAAAIPHQQKQNYCTESPVGTRNVASLSGRQRVPSTPDAKIVFRDNGSNSNHGTKSNSLLPAPPEESPLLMPKIGQGDVGAFEIGARVLTDSSEIPAFPSIGENSSSGEDRRRRYSQASQSSQKSISLKDATDATPVRSFSSHNSHNAAMYGSNAASSRHQQSLVLTPGNYEETPVIGNARKVIDNAGSFDDAALLPPNGNDDELSDGPHHIPFIPSLAPAQGGEYSPALHHVAPPRSIIMDELRLVEMETGNSSIHWGVGPENDLQLVHAQNQDFDLSFAQEGGYDSSEGSDISIPSNDPRKSIPHKRSNLEIDTNATLSLQSDINFDDLQLQEVIGGGGFGQVWRASLRGTPVAVKVLTGSAQNTHIAKAILEEFRAEINLLKGMRHPNICLYMGACVDPPNRAIITELAANGSVWDALRLPLMPPYVAADGTPQGSWPMSLYLPDHRGAPPSSFGAPRISAPIPPRGSWPFELVKRVSCGAARGMAYLHGGKPPVLHRDLKSANLLLDESYNSKVCDFGLSRLKAQTRSMTGNCGTVQWMAPEVLANRSYDEKADVYSFGIIVWELLSRECPYEGMTAIQCALAVLNRDKRPEIPKWCPPGLHALIKACTKKEPDERPSFERIIEMLDSMH
ncbi:protein tyrosine kinase [Nitzschia inconspicua]|uniref:Protein tyrosine kinase n=1 Tax=Nitzschia inconspicua TaxID=303405 RepID=A0A9K3PS57_9STRA|nr:protein tyrosine kinase [Nitzschia inconspicua]